MKYLLNIQYFGRGSSKAGGGSVSRGGSNSQSANAGQPNEATEWYVSGDGMWINQYLRGRGDFGELSQEEKQYLHDLDVATDGQIKDDVLYRSVDAEAIFGQMSDTDYDNLRQSVNYGMDTFGKGAYADGIRNRVNNIIDNTEGKTVTEKGFMSTTTSRDVAEDWGGFTGAERPVVMKIKTSPKTKGVDLSVYDKNVDAGDAQHERLLARNQQFVVEKVYSFDNYLYVDVKMK